MNLYLVEIEREVVKDYEIVLESTFHSFLSVDILSAYAEAKRLYWWPVKDLVRIPR